MLKEDVLALLQFCDFSGEITHETFESKIINKLKISCNLEFEYLHGATKIVLILPNEDFVIKIPFNGDYDYHNKFYNFCGAYSIFEEEYSEDKWDYCNREKEIYLFAASNNFQYLFAKTELIGYVQGYPIYTQTKAKIYKEDIKKKNYYQKLASTKKKCREINCPCFCEGWLVDVIDYYGEKEFEKIMLFLQDNELDGDLHDSNLGYIDGKPVLVDYSDYFD